MSPRGRAHEKLRGRPRGNTTQDYIYLESLVLIASKHELDPKQLIDAFYEALEKKRASCGSLKISCRTMDQDSATFLVTQGERVVWQFPVALETIRNPDIRDSIKKIPLPEKRMRAAASERNLKIDQLRFGMRGINVQAEIVEIPQTKEVITRWGSMASVSNIKLADDTESIRLGLWNNQIKMVQIGDEVEIKNCSVTRFAGELQLKLGRRGTVAVINGSQQELIAS